MNIKASILTVFVIVVIAIILRTVQKNRLDPISKPKKHYHNLDRTRVIGGIMITLSVFLVVSTLYQICSHQFTNEHRFHFHAQPIASQTHAQPIASQTSLEYKRAQILRIFCGTTKTMAIFSFILLALMLALVFVYNVYYHHRTDQVRAQQVALVRTNLRSFRHPGTIFVNHGQAGSGFYWSQIFGLYQEVNLEKYCLQSYENLVDRFH